MTELLQRWCAFALHLKQEAEVCLLSVRRDRGSDLFFGPLRPGAAIPPGFTGTIRGRFAALSPTAQKIRTFLSPAGLPPAADDELFRLLALRADCPVSEAELALCLLGCKRMEERTTPDMIRDYEKDLRQLAAVCLRTGHGGLLWACALCLARMSAGENA